MLLMKHLTAHIGHMNVSFSSVLTELWRLERELLENSIRKTGSCILTTKTGAKKKYIISTSTSDQCLLDTVKIHPPTTPNY